jgi:hypothetical protein
MWMGLAVRPMHRAAQMLLRAIRRMTIRSYRLIPVWRLLPI